MSNTNSSLFPRCVAAPCRTRQNFVLLGVLGAVWTASLSSGYAQTAPAGAAPSVGRTPTARTDASMFQQLMSETGYWLSQRRFDRAQDAVQRALDIQPRNAQALVLLGTVQKARGDMEGAQRTLAMLQASGAPVDMVDTLRTVIDAQPLDQAALAQARALAAEGKVFAAAQKYRALFPHGPPPDLALEYYGVLGATVLGYQEAVSKLDALLRRNPSDVDARLLFDRILTYRETSRAAGLDGLKRLARGDVPVRIRTQAQAAWRQALLWEPAIGATIPQYYEWLSQHPSDTEIAERLEKAREEQKRIDADTARMTGFQNYGNGQMAEAEQEFAKALAYNPKDAAALGGMALIAQNRHDWPQAQTMFQRAIEADPATAEHWQTALDAMKKSMVAAPVATVASTLPARINHEILTQNSAAARQDIARLAQEPGQQMTALLFRATLELREGHRDEAKEAYRSILMRSPRHAVALATLVDMLLQDGQLDEAEDVLRRAGDSRPDLAARLRNAQLVGEAEEAQDSSKRIALLQDAVQAAPQDAWTRLKLAQTLAESQRASEGQALMDGLLEQPHPQPAAIEAAAIYADGQNDFARARTLVDRLPQAQQSAAMQAIGQRAQAGLEVDRLAQEGPQGLDGLKALAQQPDPDGHRAPLLAEALLRQDAVDDAYNTLKRGEAEAPDMSPPSRRLGYAGLYLRLMAQRNDPALHQRVAQDVQRSLNAFDHDMQATDNVVTPAQKQVREQIEAGLVAMQADDMTRAGHASDARAYLAPFVMQHPGAVQSRLAMGRAYAAEGRPERALAEDQVALQQDPDNSAALEAAVHDAVQAGKPELASTLEKRLSRTRPDTVETWRARAEIAQAAGDSRAQLAAEEQIRIAECAGRTDGTCDQKGILKPDYRWPQVDSPYQDLQGAMLPDAYHYLVQDSAAEEASRSVVYLRDSVSPQLDGNMFVRNRTGTAGLGQLTELAVPLTGSLPFGSWDHRVSFSITPTFLFTGNPLSNEGSNHQFGICSLVGTSGQCPSSFGHHYYVQGVGLNLQYVHHWFSANVGSSPLGFPIANVLGGVEFAPHLTRNLVLRLKGGRQMVTDSELSYAGMREPITGEKWGGVTRIQGHGTLEWGEPNWNVYAGGGFSYLEGTNVNDNTGVDVEAGGSAVVWKADNRQFLRTGLDFIYLNYRSNSYSFSWGQGGYFSPQGYYAIMLPLEWTGHYGRWTWLLRGEAGYQHYHSKASAFFPMNDGLQSLLNEYTSAQDVGGVAGNVRGRVVYQLTHKLRMGLEAGYSRAGSWSEISGMIMAHYAFDGL